MVIHSTLVFNVCIFWMKLLFVYYEIFCISIFIYIGVYLVWWFKKNYVFENKICLKLHLFLYLVGFKSLSSLMET